MLVPREIGPSPQSSPDRGEEAKAASPRSFIRADLASILFHRWERRRMHEARDLIGAGARACVFA